MLWQHTIALDRTAFSHTSSQLSTLLLSPSYAYADTPQRPPTSTPSTISLPSIDEGFGPFADEPPVFPPLPRREVLPPNPAYLFGTPAFTPLPLSPSGSAAHLPAKASPYHRPNPPQENALQLELMPLDTPLLNNGELLERFLAALIETEGFPVTLYYVNLSPQIRPEDLLEPFEELDFWAESSGSEGHASGEGEEEEEEEEEEEGEEEDAEEEEEEEDHAEEEEEGWDEEEGEEE
ncbi:hypothetical protein BV20DRAFT_1056093 [Pilatotrama ljubarskyi]|nr:hypothetical protein BV20DRAFT_1056093 [Pilatotrama ljubarskyi]